MWPFLNSSLFSPPTEAWLQTVSSDPEAQGWGAWGELRKTPPGPRQGGERAEEDDDEGFSLPLLELETLSVPDRLRPTASLKSRGGMRSEPPWGALTGRPSRPAGCPFLEPPEETVEADHRSIFVGNVDYGSTAKELENYFSHCGEIYRVTILCDKFSGHPKGYAYIEFASQSSAQSALLLHERSFRGRVIKVLPKRTNFPGISSTDRGGPQAEAHHRSPGVRATAGQGCRTQQRVRLQGEASQEADQGPLASGRVVILMTTTGRYAGGTKASRRVSQLLLRFRQPVCSQPPPHCHSTGDGVLQSLVPGKL
ncbi:embryonic polyadenylate-binding protein 2 [Thomomys bottae]